MTKTLGGGFVRCAARLPSAAAAGHRPLPVFRPLRPGHRDAGGQSADVRHAPAYRSPGDGHLFIRRRDPASRQSGQRAAHRARRDQLDDRRQRHRALRAHPARSGEPHRRSPTACNQWAALPRLAVRAKKPRRRSSIRRPARCRPGAGRESAARVLIGSAFGLSSPGETFSRTLYLDIAAAPGAVLTLEARWSRSQRSTVIDPGVLLVDGAPKCCPAPSPCSYPRRAARIEAPGQRALCGDRRRADRRPSPYVVETSSPADRERIEAAKADWTAQRMGQIPGETELFSLNLRFSRQQHADCKTGSHMTAAAPFM